MLIGIASYATTREFGLRAIDLGLSGGKLITWWWDWHGALEYISFGLSTLWLAVFVAAGRRLVADRRTPGSTSGPSCSQRACLHCRDRPHR